MVMEEYFKVPLSNLKSNIYKKKNCRKYILDIKAAIASTR